jgi:hypothetical protein
LIDYNLFLALLFNHLIKLLEILIHVLMNFY